MVDKCKTKIWSGFHEHRCTRKAVLDGFCKQHHPDSVKQREEAAAKRYEEKAKESCWYKLKEAHAKLTAQAELIASLQASLAESEARVAGLLAELKSTKDRMWENGHLLEKSYGENKRLREGLIEITEIQFNLPAKIYIFDKMLAIANKALGGAE